MTRTFSDGHPKVLPACNFLSQYYFYNIFLKKSCRFSLQTLTKFEAAKTGSGVGFLRLTAVWVTAGHVSMQANQSRTEGTQRSNVARVRSSPQNFAWESLKFSKIFAFKPKVKTVAEKLSFKLRIWPGHLVMDILKSSQLVIFSHSTIFITFSYRSLAGFLFKLLRSSRRRKPEVAWIFAFDRCVHRGWVLNLILSTLSREVKVALLYRRYFESEASLIFVRDPAWQMLHLHLNSLSMRCWLS